MCQISCLYQKVHNLPKISSYAAGLFANVSNQLFWMDNNFKGRSQKVLVKCLDIVSNHNVKSAGHIQNLVRQCPMTNCYFQHYESSKQTFKVAKHSFRARSC